MKLAKPLLSSLSVALLVSCGGADSGGDADGGDGTGDMSILGPNPTVHTEQDDATNTFNAPEPTGYTFDEAGLRIVGTFDNSEPDYYTFNAGTYWGFTINVGSQAIALSVDDPDDGYSSLTINGRPTDDVVVLPSGNYRLSIAGSDIGSDYQVEILPDPDATDWR